MKQRLLSICFLILALTPLMAKAEFFYTPLYVIVDAADGRGASAITISNPTGTAARLQLSLSEWEMSPKNEVVVTERKEGQESVLDYVKINPMQFTLAPKQKKVIRIATALPTSYENKEYKLLLNMLEIGADRKSLDAPDKYTFGIVVNKQISAGAYIHKGAKSSFRANLNIKDLKVSRDLKRINLDPKKDPKSEVEVAIVKFALSYENTGNAHARKDVGARFYDVGGGLVAEERKIGGFVAVPTKENEVITYSGAFDLPEKLDKTKPYEVEFVLIDTDPMYTAGNPVDQVIKTSKVSF
jgi:hypothetical protein